MPNSAPTHRPAWAQHARSESQRYYDKYRRNKDSKALYDSQAFRVCRQIKLCAQPYCEMCLQEGRHTPAVIVHHIIEITEDASLALDIDNMQSLCRACHGSMHALNE
jgi:5-methylcytosine-specific restriction enzyme A